MNVNRENIDKAFALAHRASEDASLPLKARNVFRAVARQIWLACGADRPTATVLEAQRHEAAADEYPAGSGCELVDRRYLEALEPAREPLDWNEIETRR